MLFGNKVSKSREEKGLLLHEVASLLEEDIATVSKIELGVAQIKKTNQAFGRSIRYRWWLSSSPI